LITVLACTLPSIPGATEAPDIEGPSEDGPTETIINGSMVDQVTSVSEGDTIGPILQVQITNPTTGEVVAVIPCGLVFRPTGGDEQALMVIQEIIVAIPGGETVTVKPYVVCIETSSATPASGSDYQIGEMTTGNLLKFAECLCDEELPESMTSGPTAFQDIFGVQMAVWVVADNIAFDDVLGGGEGAAGDMEQILGPMMDILESTSQEWLEKCDIEIQP
jgi:hypothetical protein